MKTLVLIVSAIALMAATGTETRAALIVSITQYDGSNDVTAHFSGSISIPAGSPHVAESSVPNGFYNTGALQGLFTNKNGALYYTYELTPETNPNPFASVSSKPFDHIDKKTQAVNVGLAFIGVTPRVAINSTSAPPQTFSNIDVTGYWNNTTLSGLGLTTNSYSYSIGTDTVTLNIQTAVGSSPPPSVPEPSTLAVMSLGAVCVVFHARRRRNRVLQAV